MSGERGWIGVDLDGTLAHYTEWGDGSIGAPIPRMVERVKKWLAEGKVVKIVTARVSAIYVGTTADQVQEACSQAEAIAAWCREHLGREIPVTAIKDFGMIELWDDRAVQVVKNTGVAFNDHVIAHLGPDGEFITFAGRVTGNE